MSNNQKSANSSSLTKSQDSAGEAIVRQVITMKTAMPRAAMTQMPRIIARQCTEASGGNTSKQDAKISQGIERSVQYGERMGERAARAVRWVKGKRTT